MIYGLPGIRFDSNLEEALGKESLAGYVEDGEDYEEQLFQEWSENPPKGLPSRDDGENSLVPVEEDEDEDYQEEEEGEGQLDLTQYTPEQLKLLKIRYKQAESLEPLIKSVCLLEGKKGRGKTLAAVAIAYMLKEMFEIQTVCIGTSLDLNRQEFGHFTFLDEKEFVQDLDKITQVSKSTSEEVLGNAIDDLLKAKGIVIANSLLIFDEAYKLFDARTPSDKLVRIFGYFIAMSRHYKCTILIICPFRDMLDKRVRRQIDYYGRCFTNKRTGITTVRMTGGLESWKFKVYGPNYWGMYDTHALTGFRAKHLEIASY